MSGTLVGAKWQRQLPGATGISADSAGTHPGEEVNANAIIVLSERNRLLGTSSQVIG